MMKQKDNFFIDTKAVAGMAIPAAMYYMCITLMVMLCNYNTEASFPVRGFFVSSALVSAVFLLLFIIIYIFPNLNKSDKRNLMYIFAFPFLWGLSSLQVFLNNPLYTTYWWTLPILVIVSMEVLYWFTDKTVPKKGEDLNKFVLKRKGINLLFALLLLPLSSSINLVYYGVVYLIKFIGNYYMPMLIYSGTAIAIAGSAFLVGYIGMKLFQLFIWLNALKYNKTDKKVKK